MKQNVLMTAKKAQCLLCQSCQLQERCVQLCHPCVVRQSAQIQFMLCETRLEAHCACYTHSSFALAASRTQWHICTLWHRAACPSVSCWTALKTCAAWRSSAERQSARTLFMLRETKLKGTWRVLYTGFLPVLLAEHNSMYPPCCKSATCPTHDDCGSNMRMWKSSPAHRALFMTVVTKKKYHLQLHSSKGGSR